MSKRKYGEHKILSIKEKVYSFALKFYDEQLPYGLQATIDAIRQTKKEDFQVLFICHDRDEVADGIWEVAKEKQHYHMICRCTNNKSRVRIYEMLDWFHIFFRPGQDDMLLLNHAVETVDDFKVYAMYLTHETEKAKKDNKELYDVSELISNLTLDEVKAIRDGYVRIADASSKVTMSKLAELDEEAFKLGYELKSFEDWYSALNFNVRSNSKMKTILESYQRGVRKRIDERPEINRLCIYIMGDANTGKTYASKKALVGKKILNVGGGGSGKFDKLKADHDAIIIDDDVCPNLLNMADNYICYAYKRNKDNPPWAGRYLVVTSNLPFNEWLRKSGINVNANCSRNSHYAAMLSRFYICTLVKNADGTNKLACVNVSDRGSKTEQEERRAMFEAFRLAFDETIAQYTPTDSFVDYSSTLNIEEAGCMAVLAK